MQNVVASLFGMTVTLAICGAFLYLDPKIDKLDQKIDKLEYEQLNYIKDIYRLLHLHSTRITNMETVVLERDVNMGSRVIFRNVLRELIPAVNQRCRRLLTQNV